MNKRKIIMFFFTICIINLSFNDINAAFNKAKNNINISYSEDYENYREYKRYKRYRRYRYNDYYDNTYSNRRKASEFFSEGLSLYREKDYQNAINYYYKAIELNPDYSAYYYFLGLAFERLINYKSALKNYEKALQLDPEVRFTKPKEVFFFKLKKIRRLIINENKIVSKNKIQQIDASSAKKINLNSNSEIINKNSYLWNLFGFILLGLSLLILLFHLLKTKLQFFKNKF